MSHRKYEQPRHGSLGFLPRKRTKHHQGRIRAFPKDDASKKPALTAFMGYKAGMLHVVRDSAIHKMEMVEAVSIIETPPMVVCGVVGYTETPNGLRALTTVWSSLLSDSFKRRFYKNWYRCKGKAFDKYVATHYTNGKANATVERDLARIKKYCSVVRVIAHTQPRRVNIGRKKANMLEIQVNGGSIAEKVDYAVSLFEQEVPVDTVFSQDELVDIMGVTKGHGFEGVITRWGVTTLPRKTHRGLRKVACIGAWHPSRIRYTVARPGQHGYFHRTEINKKIYRIGKAARPNGAKEVVNFNATTESDLTQKVITPMGGFSSYSNVNEDFLMIKGAIVGCRKRPLTLRKSLIVNTRPSYTEKTVLKFISTASQRGHGKFQTSQEKAKFFGK